MFQGIGLTQSRSPRRTTFEDIPLYKQRKGQKPGAVFLIAPHTNELPAVKPYRRELAKGLRSEGIAIGEFNSTDRMAWGWNFRKKYGYYDFAGGKGITYVFSIRDYLARAKLIESLLSDCKDSAMVIELHAYNQDPNGNLFYGPHEWRVLKGTKILVHRDAFGSFKEGVARIINGINSRMGDVKGLAELVGFDLESGIRQLEVLIAKLKKMKSRFKLIEVPSKEAFLGPNHPRRYDYLEGKAGQERYRLNVNDFEKIYCACFRNSLGSPSPEEIQAVASILVLPPSK